MKGEGGVKIANTEATVDLDSFNMSIFGIDLVIRLNLRRNPIFGPKLGPKKTKLPKICISRSAGRRKLVDPSKEAENPSYRGVLRCVYPSDHRKSLIRVN